MSNNENAVAPIEEENPLDALDLPKSAYKFAHAARKLQDTYEELEKQYKAERIALEKKFLEKKNAFYAERKTIIDGEKEVPEVEGGVDEETTKKGIPSFWLTALSTHPTIGSLVTEEDVPALDALNDVTCTYADDFTSFTLTFTFDENEFFTNKTLTKTYIVSPDLLDDKSPALESVEATEIDWKPSKNLCVTEIKKKQKAKSGRNKGQVRTITKTTPKPSFFHYFDKRSEEDEEEEEPEEENEDDEQGPIKLTLDEDYDVGHIIRTTIIPEATLWFTGEAAEDLDFMLGDEDEEDDEDDEDGDDDEDDEDDGDNKKPKAKLTAGAGGFATTGAAGGAAGNNPECKQN